MTTTAVTHGCARTDALIRQDIQASNDSISELARRYGLTRATVRKWKRRSFVHDARSAPFERGSSSRSALDQIHIDTFRRHTLLPLDDCLYALKFQMPHLTRSALHRCLQRRGISRLPKTEAVGGRRTRRSALPLGSLFYSVHKLPTGEGDVYVHFTIDRCSKVIHLSISDDGDEATAAGVVAQLLENLPYRITSLTTGPCPTNVPNWCEQRRAGSGGMSLLEAICRQHGALYQFVDPTTLWPTGAGPQEGDSEALDRHQYDTVAQVAAGAREFVLHYNFILRFKVLGGRTPFRNLCDLWGERPELFLRDPHEGLFGHTPLANDPSQITPFPSGIPHASRLPG